MTAAFVLQSVPNIEFVFNVVRGFLYLWAGYRVVRIAGRTAFVAGVAGAALLFIDHVLLKGSCYAAQAAFSSGSERHFFLMSAIGVLVSYCMFLVVPAAISVTGALIAKATTKRGTAHA